MIPGDSAGFLSHRLFVTDVKSRIQFLVDSGSDLSLLPISFRGCRSVSSYVLNAANGTTIKTYGSKLLTLDLGLRRKLNFAFIIAGVSKPILGADFLQHFGLIVDIKNRKLLDPLTSCEHKGKVLPTYIYQALRLLLVTLNIIVWFRNFLKSQKLDQDP